MNRFFIFLTALVLSLTTANAQISNGSIKTLHKPLTNISPSHVASPKSLKAKSNPNRIQLENDERLVGFYTTDDLPDLSYGGYLGLTSYPGQLQVGAIFEDDVFNKYVGGEITKVRFALGSLTSVAGLYIYEVSTDYSINMDNPLAFVDLSSSTLSAGWNDISLPTPVKIEDGKYYLIAYEYTQTTLNYPIVTDMELDVDVTPNYGFVVYGDLNNIGQDDWYIFSGYGSICIQAVVNSVSLIDDDISIKNLSADKYVKPGNELNYNYNIKNDGKVLPSSYSLSVSIDGTIVDTVDTPIELTNSWQIIAGKLTVSSDLTVGYHTLSINVDKINGNIPTQYIDDDVAESKFVVYVDQTERQMNLIEEFTSVQCGYCPLAHDILNTMQERNPDKYALVAIHGAGMGDDPFYLSDGSSDYIETYAEVSSYPSAAFNRYFYNDSYLNPYGELALSLGYEETETAAILIDNLVNNVYDNLPAFASVDITTDYNEDTRELTIKVSGDGVSEANNILDGNRLTVYLTEDELVSSQLNYYVSGYVVQDYVHNNVLRAIVSEQGFPYCGDVINWTSDKTYENDYTVTLDSSWNPDNMHVVAFISRAFAVEMDDGDWYWADDDDGLVNNANMTKVGGSTGINNPISNFNATETSRFTIDGRQISNPVKGLNIVKMSDGSARKVIVK